MISFMMGLLAVNGFSDVDAHVDLGAHRTEVVGLKFGKSLRRRRDSSEHLVVDLGTGGDLVLPLSDTKDRAVNGFCESSHVGKEMDVVVTGCEGDDRRITIGGHGSWEYTTSTGEFRRMGSKEIGDSCKTMEAPDDDEDHLAMKIVAEAFKGRTIQRNWNAPSEFDMEVRYYYDRTLLAKYNGNHGAAQDAVREIHSHAKVMMRHDSIGLKVHLLTTRDPEFMDASLEADGPQLNQFEAWLISQGSCDRTTGFHHLVTAKGDDNGTAANGRFTSGIAWGSAACHDACWNSGITEEWSTVTEVAQTLAHELGHNLGMKHTHDDEMRHRNCRGIMSYGEAPDTWSMCSRESWQAYYDTFVQTRGQSRADGCFRPHGSSGNGGSGGNGGNGGATNDEPTWEPTREPTDEPTQEPTANFWENLHPECEYHLWPCYFNWFCMNAIFTAKNATPQRMPDCTPPGASRPQAICQNFVDCQVDHAGRRRQAVSDGTEPERYSEDYSLEDYISSVDLSRRLEAAETPLTLDLSRRLKDAERSLTLDLSQRLEDAERSETTRRLLDAEISSETRDQLTPEVPL